MTLRRNNKSMLKMTRPFLILLWGILLLTIVDGAYLARIQSYSANENIHHNSQNDNNQEKLDGPVFTVFIEGFDAIEGFIERHEKALTVLSAIAVAWFTATLWRATTGMQDLATIQANDMKVSLRIATEAANAARDSADIGVKAVMPVLFPLIIDGSTLLPPENVVVNAFAPALTCMF